MKFSQGNLNLKKIINLGRHQSKLVNTRRTWNKAKNFAGKNNLIPEEVCGDDQFPAGADDGDDGPAVVEGQLEGEQLLLVIGQIDLHIL